MRPTVRGGPVVKLKGLIERKNADGTVRRYLRRRGQIVAALPGDCPIDDPRFLAAYAEAAAGEPPPGKPGTIAALVIAALRSDRYRQCSDSYKAMIRRDADAIRAAYGTGPARGIRDRHIKADVTSAPDPRKRLKAWRMICAHGLDAGLIETDPSTGVKVARTKTDGFPPWTLADIEAFRVRWPIGTAARAALELLFWTGARVSDGVSLGPGMVGKDGVLSFRQEKTGYAAYVPWTNPLPAWARDMAEDREMMHAALSAVAGGHMTFLATAYGAPRSIKGLSNVVKRGAVAAGIEGRSAHGLRKSRAQALADAGATTHQIAAWTGHESLKEVEHYTRASDRRRAVRGAEGEQDLERPPAKVERR